MRLQATFLALLFATVAGPGTSWAEKVRTNAKAKVYNRPGEQGQVVVKVKEGQAMTVIGKEGRWLKVRVSGRTGYIPRTKVDMPEEDEDIVRNTRRRPFVDGRGTKRGFGNSSDSPDDRIGADAVGGGSDDSDSSDDDDGGDKVKPKPKAKPKAKPTDDDDSDSDEDTAKGEDKDEGGEVADDRPKARVSAKVAVYSEPDKTSDKAFTATPSDTLFIESIKGKWTEVSVEEGDIGWIQTSKLAKDEDGGGSEGGGRRIIDVRARLGWTLVSQKLSSSGGAGVFPDQYTVGSSSFAISLGGTILKPYKKNLLLGGEITYDLAVAMPGITYDPDGGGATGGPMPSSTTGFKIHQINIRALAGYDFHKPSGLAVFGRLGYHRDSFTVSNYEDLTKNTARLPQEIIQGPMIGVGLAIPHVSTKIGLKLSLDAVLFGASVAQTRYLEDGSDPTAKRITAGATFIYRFKAAYDLTFGYDMNYASLAFGAPVADSQRGHTGMSVTRTDLNHTIVGGINKTF